MDRGLGPRLRWVVSGDAAAIAGAVCAVLLWGSVLLLTTQPDAGASDEELTRWFADAGNRRLVLAGLQTTTFGGIAFLWFLAVIRRRLGDREDQFFATVFLGSGLLFLTLTIASAVAAAAPALMVSYGGREAADPSTFALARGLWFGLFVVGASRFGAVFMVVTSTLGLRFGVLPRWLSIVGYAASVVLFVTGAFSGPLAFLFPVWMAVVSLTLFVSRRRGGPTDS